MKKIYIACQSLMLIVLAFCIKYHYLLRAIAILDIFMYIQTWKYILDEDYMEKLFCMISISTFVLLIIGSILLHLRFYVWSMALELIFVVDSLNVILVCLFACGMKYVMKSLKK